MRRLWVIAGLSVAISLVGVGRDLAAQETKNQDTKKNQDSQSATPDEAQKQPAKDATPPNAPTAQQKPAPPPSARKHSTADDNPFPEDVSKKAAASAAPDVPPANPEPAGDSSSRAGADNLDVLGTKQKDKGDRTKLQLTSPDTGQPYDPKLADEDIRIGEFYLKNGAYPGAYARFKEASAANPGDPRAVFGLAEAARKMNRTKEAADNYQVYLDAFPDGPKAKAARKALSELKIPSSNP